MAIFGPWAALSIGTLVLPHSDPFLSVQFNDIVAFLGLLTGGFTLRRNPAAHRRMMMQATASIADSGFSRLEFHFFNWHAHAALLFFLMIFYGNVLIVALMAAWDCWRGRLMRSFVIGAAALVAVEVLMILGAKVADNSGVPLRSGRSGYQQAVCDVRWHTVRDPDYSGEVASELSNGLQGMQAIPGEAGYRRLTDIERLPTMVHFPEEYLYVRRCRGQCH